MRLSEFFAVQVPAGRISMAALQEYLLRHRRDPEVAAHEAVFDNRELDGEGSAPCGAELIRSS